MKTNLLKAEIVKNGMTQKQLCEAIKMSQSTFIRKIKKGVFNTNDIKKIVTVLKIDKPELIFFNWQLTS